MVHKPSWWPGESPICKVPFILVTTPMHSNFQPGFTILKQLFTLIFSNLHHFSHDFPSIVHSFPSFSPGWNWPRHRTTGASEAPKAVLGHVLGHVGRRRGGLAHAQQQCGLATGLVLPVYHNQNWSGWFFMDYWWTLPHLWLMILWLDDFSWMISGSYPINC